MKFIYIKKKKVITKNCYRTQTGLSKFKSYFDYKNFGMGIPQKQIALITNGKSIMGRKNKRL